MQYVELLRFLREEVAVKRNKTLVFRTWDTGGFTADDPPRMHGNLSYYRKVTDQVPPHPSLYFSIKHTMLDFWRRVRFNPTISNGIHAQIVEAEMAREYDGNGAYPHYIAAGLIDGFPEFAKTAEAENGLAAVLRRSNNGGQSSVVRGVWTWARGGGWYGPYTLSEAWPALNMWVVSQWWRAQMLNGTVGTGLDCLASPRDYVTRFVTEIAQLPPSVEPLFHAIANESTLAVLEMHYCEAADAQLHGQLMPTNNWMRYVTFISSMLSRKIYCQTCFYTHNNYVIVARIIVHISFC